VIPLFYNKWGFDRAVHGTQTYLKRDPRCNFMKNNVFLGILAGPFVINDNHENVNMQMVLSSPRSLGVQFCAKCIFKKYIFLKMLEQELSPFP
jgi:hypothetical protein